MATKCPNCGSTAQVRTLKISSSENVLTEKFICGCGCRFDADYLRGKDGFWEIYSVSVVYQLNPTRKREF